MSVDDFTETAVALAAMRPQDQMAGLWRCLRATTSCTTRHVLILVLLLGEADLMNGVARISLRGAGVELGITPAAAGGLLDDLERVGVIRQRGRGERRIVVFPAAIRAEDAKSHRVTH